MHTLALLRSRHKAPDLEIGHVRHHENGAPFALKGSRVQAHKCRTPSPNLRFRFVWLARQFTTTNQAEKLVLLA
jgi:hypothetical protein